MNHARTFRRDRGQWSRAMMAAVCLFAALALPGCDRAGTRDEGAADQAARAAEVRAASAAWDAAHNAGDVAALMELYADSAVSMPYDRPAIVGRTAIADDMRSFFQDYTATHATEIVGLEITGDWAIERGRYSLSSTPRDGGTAMGEVGKHIVVRHRVNGAWKIHWEIWNLDSARVP